MNETNPVLPKQLQPKAKRKRKVTEGERAPRVVDPAIAAINETARKQRQEHRKTGVIARILRVILEKRIAQLTQADQQKLLDYLSRSITPPLPGVNV